MYLKKIVRSVIQIPDILEWYTQSIRSKWL